MHDRDLGVPSTDGGRDRPDRDSEDPRFRPTAYTAGLLEACLQVLARRTVHHGFEVGVGGGYVMAALLQAGAQRFEGVDILPQAVACAHSLLQRLGLSDRATVEVGDLWHGRTGARFDLIAANLPQFPLSQPLDETHPHTWSDGGPDGRRVIDPFLDGLAAHLAPGGTAVMTHNVFVDLPRTLQRASAEGLVVRELARHLVPLSTHRVAELHRLHSHWGRGGDVLAENGLISVGPQVFGAFVVLELHKPAGPTDRTAPTTGPAASGPAGRAP